MTGLPQRMSPPRAALLATVVLGCCVNSGAGIHTGSVRGYGDPEFYVMLRGMNPNLGSLKPDFARDTSDYLLEVDDSSAQFVALTMLLDLEKYNLMFPPKITLDNGTGTGWFEATENPLEPTRFIIPLNKSIGAYDTTVHAKLEDPKSGGPFGMGKNEFTYNIRVIQPPDYSRIVDATALSLSKGKVKVPADHTWTTNSTEHKYHFILDGTSTVYDFDFKCPEERGVTALHDGNVGALTKVDMTSDIVKRIELVCSYTDDTWQADGRPHKWMPIQRVYDLTFRRVFAFATVHKMLMELKMLPRYGYCERIQENQRLLADAADAEDAPQTVEEHGIRFLCRALTQNAQMLVLFDKNVNGTQATPRAQFVHPNGVVEPIIDGVPMQTLTLDGLHTNYKLRLEAGQTPVEYPVEVVEVAHCKTLTCQDGLVHREIEEDEEEDAMLRLCHDIECKWDRDTCPEDSPDGCDWDRCCGKRAMCDTLPDHGGCKEHKDLKENADEIQCEGTICHTEVDDGVCCVHHIARCGDEGYECPEHYAFREHHQNIKCHNWHCTEEDDDTCCVLVKAKCAFYTWKCPIHQEVHPDRTCADWACHEEADQATCCVPMDLVRAKCSTYSWACPHHQEIHADRECAGWDCHKESDEATCCVDMVATTTTTETTTITVTTITVTLAQETVAAMAAAKASVKVGEHVHLVCDELSPNTQVILRSDSTGGGAEEKGRLTKKVGDAKWEIAMEDDTKKNATLKVGDVIVSDDNRRGVISIDSDECPSGGTMMNFAKSHAVLGTHSWVLMPGDQLIRDGDHGVLHGPAHSKGEGWWRVDWQDGSNATIRLRVGDEVISEGVKGEVASEAHVDGSITIHFTKTMSALQPNDPVMVYGTPAIIYDGPNAMGMYRVRFDTDDEVSFPLPVFVIKTLPKVYGSPPGELICPLGHEILTLTECKRAAESLGYKVHNISVYHAVDLPYGCSYCTECTSPTNPDGTPQHRLHMNMQLWGAGRPNLTPICRGPLPTATAEKDAPRFIPGDQVQVAAPNEAAVAVGMIGVVVWGPAHDQTYIVNFQDSTHKHINATKLMLVKSAHPKAFMRADDARAWQGDGVQSLDTGSRRTLLLGFAACCGVSLVLFVAVRHQGFLREAAQYEGTSRRSIRHPHPRSARSRPTASADRDLLEMELTEITELIRADDNRSSIL